MWYLIQSSWCWKVKHRIFLACLCITSFILGLGRFIPSPTVPWSAQYIAVQSHKQYSSATFGEKIVAIQCKIGELEPPRALLQSKDFVAIYSHPKYYYGHIWSVLESFWFTQEQKMIVAYGMEALPLADYLDFASKSLLLYQKGILPEKVFKIILGDNPICRQPLIENQNNPEVIAWLLSIPIDMRQHIHHKHIDIDLTQSFIPRQISLKKTIEDILQTQKVTLRQAHPNMCSITKINDFMTIFTHPDAYIEQAVHILEEENIPCPYYCVIDRAMVHATNYAKLIPFYARAYMEGRLPGNILHWCFIDFYRDVNKNIIIDYQHPTIQATLAAVLKIKQLPADFKIKMANIKSGKAKILHSTYGAGRKQDTYIIFHENTKATRYWDTLLGVCFILIIIIYYIKKGVRYLDKVALQDLD